MSTAEDPRYRTKIYLETYLESSNITEDDGSTAASIIVCYADPDYPLIRVFTDKAVDVVFAVGEPNSSPFAGADHTAYGYEEHVPVTVYCVDKDGVTAAKVKWKAERELRRVVETYPLGSLRCLEHRRNADSRQGTTTIYGTEWVLRYVRDTT